MTQQSIPKTNFVRYIDEDEAILIARTMIKYGFKIEENYEIDPIITLYELDKSKVIRFGNDFAKQLIETKDDVFQYFYSLGISEDERSETMNKINEVFDSKEPVKLTGFLIDFTLPSESRLKQFDRNSYTIGNEEINANEEFMIYDESLRSKFTSIRRRWYDTNLAKNCKVIQKHNNNYLWMLPEHNMTEFFAEVKKTNEMFNSLKQEIMDNYRELKRKHGGEKIRLELDSSESDTITGSIKKTMKIKEVNLHDFGVDPDLRPIVFEKDTILEAIDRSMRKDIDRHIRDYMEDYKEKVENKQENVIKELEVELMEELSGFLDEMTRYIREIVEGKKNVINKRLLDKLTKFKEETQSFGYNHLSDIADTLSKSVKAQREFHYANKDEVEERKEKVVEFAHSVADLNGLEIDEDNDDVEDILYEISIKTKGITDARLVELAKMRA